MLVVALGGNALLQRGQPLTAEVQLQNMRRAAIALAALANYDHILVTHGNGPQVGLLALQAEAYKSVPPYPLDVLGAESEGMIGYLLEQELRNCLPSRPIVTLLTQIEVDPQDQHFKPLQSLLGLSIAKPKPNSWLLSAAMRSQPMGMLIAGWFLRPNPRPF